MNIWEGKLGESLLFVNNKMTKAELVKLIAEKIKTQPSNLRLSFDLLAEILIQETKKNEEFTRSLAGSAGAFRKGQERRISGARAGSRWGWGRIVASLFRDRENCFAMIGSSLVRTDQQPA